MNTMDTWDDGEKNMDKPKKQVNKTPPKKTVWEELEIRKM